MKTYSEEVDKSSHFDRCPLLHEDTFCLKFLSEMDM